MEQNVRPSGKDAIEELTLGALAPVHLQDRIHALLRQALMEGRFEPGTVLTMRSLAKVMGTSLIPVRDALQRLIAERALVQGENRSASVPVLSRDDVEELLALRIMLEGAAMDRLPEQISAQDLDALELCQHKLELAVQRGDADAVTKANTEFHFILYNLARGPLMLAMIESLWVRAGPMMRTPWREESLDPKVYQDCIIYHRRILKALREDDRLGARQAIQEDIASMGTWYLARMLTADLKA